METRQATDQRYGSHPVCQATLRCRRVRNRHVDLESREQYADLVDVIKSPDLGQRGDRDVPCLYATCCESVLWGADKSGSPPMFCGKAHTLLYRSERATLLRRLAALADDLALPATNGQGRRARRVRLELLRQLAHYPIADLNAYFRGDAGEPVPR